MGILSADVDVLDCKRYCAKISTVGRGKIIEVLHGCCFICLALNALGSYIGLKKNYFFFAYHFSGKYLVKICNAKKV